MAHRYGSSSTDNTEHDDVSDDYYWPGSSNWNGYAIYLSPAHHWNGWKWGCDDYAEDFWMQNGIVPAAASGEGSDLQARGYYVRVGAADPDENVIRSNGWLSSGSDYHIPIHSNAHGSDNCGSYSASQSGTIVFHYPGSAAGEGLADSLAYTVGGESPGTTDYTTDATFYELSETRMPAAYIETEFHDWQTGVDWLKSYNDWTWRIGWGVDRYLGYP